MYRKKCFSNGRGSLQFPGFFAIGCRVLDLGTARPEGACASAAQVKGLGFRV